MRSLLNVLLAGCILAGCVDDGASTPPGGETVAGTWTLSTNGECRQGLWLGGGNRWRWQAEFRVLGLGLISRAAGSYSGDGRTDLQGDFASSFSADGRVAPLELAYCDQWLEAQTSALPFSTVARDTGLDPAALSYRVVYAPGVGPFYVGSDGQEADRFGLYRDGSGDVHGFHVSDHLPPDTTLFYRKLGGLVSFLVEQENLPALNLPQRAWSRVYPPTSAGEVVDKVPVVINAAAEVTFSAVPDAPEPACRFQLYETLDFLELRTQQQLDPDASTQTVRYNPGDDAQIFSTGTYTEDGQTRSAFVLPLGIVTPDGNACSANVSARPVPARLVGLREAQGSFADTFTLPLGAGGAFVPGFHATLPGRALSLPLLAEGAAWEGLGLEALVVSPPAPEIVDVLGLITGGPTPLQLSLSESGGVRVLNLFSDGSASQGLGPFQAYRPPADADPLDVPGSFTGTFDPGEGARAFRFVLPSQARVQIAAQGSADTAGLLRDGAGRIVAWDEDGAADGIGFRMRRTLPAGAYDLIVRAGPAGGGFTLTLDDPAPAPPVADENLEACLIAAGAIDNPLADVRRLVCPARDIADLTGIGELTGLTRLSLAGNRVTDPAPLQGLSRLHSLSLAGNPVGPLDALADLPGLYRLSLARTVLTTAQLAALQALRQGLSLLVLKGVRGVAEADVAALKAAMPNTVIVTPAGEVLE